MFRSVAPNGRLVSNLLWTDSEFRIDWVGPIGPTYPTYWVGLRYRLGAVNLIVDRLF